MSSTLGSLALGLPASATVEGQFNPRVACRDYEAIQEERRRRSQQVLATGAAVVHGATASSRPVTLIHPAGGGSGETVLIFLHGGYWRAGAAEDNAFIFPALRQLGIFPVLMGYPLCPAVTLPELMETVRENVSWIIDHVADIGADAGPVLVGGVSAGACLAASLLARTESEAHRIGGVLLLTGIYDLTPVPLISVNTDVRLDEADAISCSPMFDPPERPLPVVLAVGADEPVMWRSQTLSYAALCRASGCSVTLIDLQGRNHFTVIDALEDTPGDLVAALSAMTRVVAGAA